MRLQDVSITGTRADSRGRYGMGLAVLDGASVTGERLRLQGNRYAGVLVANNFRNLGGAETAESEAVLRDLEVRDTALSLGGEGEEDFGDGLTVIHGAEAAVERFEVHDNARVGLLVGGEADFRQASAFFKDGEITGQIIGVSISSEWMSLDRDFDNVSCYDNDVNISSRTLAVPDFSMAF